MNDVKMPERTVKKPALAAPVAESPQETPVPVPEVPAGKVSCNTPEGPIEVTVAFLGRGPEMQINGFTIFKALQNAQTGMLISLMNENDQMREALQMVQMQQQAVAMQQMPLLEN